MCEYEPFTVCTRTEVMESVSQQLSKKRWAHCLRVEEQALKLAKHYDVNEKQVSLAALVHDLAKEWSIEKLQESAKLYRLPERFWNQGSEILHGPIASNWIQEHLHIHDSQIIDAVFEHTIGGHQMSMVSKILFVADATEQGRDYPGVEEARRISFENIDEAVVYLMKHTIAFLLTKDVPIFEDTIQIYNTLIQKKERKINE